MRNLITMDAEAVDRTLKLAGPVYRSRRQHASDPCVCAHPRELHLQEGGCRACLCDIPATEISAFAA